MNIGRALGKRLSNFKNTGLYQTYSSGDRQSISVTDLISEGPIQGLVEGGKSVLLNNDPLMSNDQTVYSSPAGGKVTVTSGNSTATITKGLDGEFEVSNPEEGTRFLMLHGAYTMKATMGAIIPITTDDEDDSEVQNQNIPLGGVFPLTRVSGAACDDAWNTNAAAQAYLGESTRTISDGTTQAVVKLASGREVRGSIYDMVDGQNAYKIMYKAPIASTNLATTADVNGSTQHDIEINLFLAISSISGTTITLANNAPTAFEGSCSITGPIIADNAMKLDSSTNRVASQKYPGAYFSFRPGTIDQDPIQTIMGVGSSSVSILSGSLAMEKDSAQTITYSQTAAAEIDFIRLTFTYPSGLYVVSENSGTEYNGAAAYKIEFCGVRPGRTDEYVVIDGGGTANGTPCFVHSGKYKSGVVFEAAFDVEPYKPFVSIKVRITRLTNHEYDDPVPEIPFTGRNNTKTRLKGIYTSSITSGIGVIKENLNYPFTSFANVTFSSKSFSDMPSRTYDCQGMKVLVPSNYVTREEANSTQSSHKRNVSTGAIENDDQFWDGNFRTDKVYTDNPAWVFYDILIHDRYGLGDFLKSSDIDRFSLYKIARYCDELVPDGKGGTEPRFKANLYLTKGADAFKVLKDMATVFRGMLYWQDGKITTIQDSKSEPVYNFSRTNVIDGKFSYETTGDKTRVNQIIVSWNNPLNEYRLEPILVEDREHQIRTGKVKSMAATAFGCTSEGQAVRYGRWKLWTSINQTEVVSFQTSLNAAFLMPGDVVNIQDEADFTIPFSGRINACTNSAITIDRDISSQFAGGHTYDIAVVLPRRAAILNQDSATINSASVTRGQEVTQARLVAGGSQATLVVASEETTEKNIASAMDDSDNLLDLQYAKSTVIEERTLTTASTTTSNGRNTIPISSAFSETPASGAIWAIKQTPTGSTVSTASSYKEYKIMAVAQGEDEKYDIVAAEYSQGKFDDIENEFNLAVEDPLYPPEGIEDVPKPRNLRILRAPDPSMPGEELIVRWDPPEPVGSATISTSYEEHKGYQILHSFDKESSEGLIGQPYLHLDKEVTSLKFNGVVNGIHTVYVRTVSAKNRVSTAAYAIIEVDDIFDGDFPRHFGIAKGGYTSCNAEMGDDGAEKGTFKFSQTSYVAAPFQDIDSAVRNTSADADSYQLVCTALAHANWPKQSGSSDTGFIMMDFSALNAASPNANALKLVSYKDDTTLGIAYWFDGVKFVADATSIWTNVATDATMTQGSRAVTGTGFSSLKVPEAIKVGNSFGAKVAYIESNTLLYLDRPWEASTAASQTLQKQELDINYETDFLISPVSYTATGTKYKLGGSEGLTTFLQVQDELSKVGRSIVTSASEPNLQYSADNSQVTTYSNISLEMTAVGFMDAEFRVTGAGFSQTNVSAETAYTAGTNNKRTMNIHTGSGAITYSATPMLFTIEARERAFPNNTNKAASTSISIPKIREGQQGASSALIYLYKNATTVPDSPDNSFPTCTVTLSGTNGGTITAISSGSISSDQIGSTGWYTKPQAPGTGEKQWLIAATANGTGTTDDITYSEWTDPPTQFSGADGAAGVNSAIVELYQRTDSASAPSAPGSTLTYTFADGSLSGSLGSWTRTPTTPIANSRYLWKTTAAAIANTATDTISAGGPGSGDWSTPIMAAQYGAKGDDGAVGKRTFHGTMYYGSGQTSNSAPNAPGNSGAFAFSNQSFSGNTDVANTSTASKWSLQAPTFAPYDGSDNKLYWFACSVDVEETTAAGGTGTPVFSNVHLIHNFSGVVAFTDLENQNENTTIHGGNITTGTIQGPDFGGTSASGTNRGMKIILNPTNDSNTTTIMEARSQGATKFSLKQDGTAFFAGEISGGEFTGTSKLEGTGNTLTVGTADQIVLDGENQQIKITDGTNTRVKIGNLAV